jgi:hypothetical protein
VTLCGNEKNEARKQNDLAEKNMTTNQDIACDRIRDAIAHKFLVTFEMTRVDTLPYPVYSFNPDGWEIYSVTGPVDGITCEDGDFWGYHPESGEIRHLIMRRIWWGVKGGT